MANTSFVRGIVPVSVDGEPIKTITVEKKATTAANVFMYSPVFMDSGEAETVGTTNANPMTGVVMAMYDSNGVQVQNLATTAAGTLTITYLANQRYKGHVLSTNYVVADDPGVQRYLISAEDSTVASGENLGDSYSGRTIGADDASGQLLAGEMVRRDDNAAATAYTEIYVTIANHDAI